MRSSRAVVIVVFLCLVAASCGGSDEAVSSEPIPVETAAASPTATESAPSAGEPDPTAVLADTPAAESDATVGDFDRDAFAAALLAEMEAWLAESTAPGIAISVRLPGQEAINLAAGVANIETAKPVESTDYFRIASITKTMTAAVMLTLVEEGLVDIELPVSTYLGDDWLGDHPSSADITVAQLMNHTNGLIEYAFDIGFYVEAADRQDQPFAPEEILEFLSRQEPLFEAGSAYQYETGGFVAAGLIIQAVTGNSAAAEMRARLFEPAGANTIFLTPQEFPPVDVVNAYVRGELYSALRLLVPEYDVGLTVGSDDPVLDVLAGEQAVLQSAGWTGGGNEAQMESVSAIWRAMFDGTVLSPESIKLMTNTVFESNYGLGLDVDTVAGELVYSHGGGVPGFRSQAGYLPDHDIAYAFSVNLIPLPDGADVGVLTEAIIPLLVQATG